jgi:hypothetical protein
MQDKAHTPTVILQRPKSPSGGVHASAGRSRSSLPSSPAHDPINDFANVSAYGKTAYTADAGGVIGKVSA